MADIILKYLTDLPSSSSAAPTDLMHINQSGNDRSITLEALAAALFNMRYPVGKVEWFANDVNPNAIWQGSTWARIPGAGKTIRLANSTGSDVLQQGGSDSVSLSGANIPAHVHSVNLRTDQFDYGAKNTSQDSHSHTVSLRSIGQLTGGSYDGSSDDIISTQSTNTSGYQHSHSVAIGAHDHPVSGDTGSTGDGTQFSVINQYVKLSGWYRTA
ncbi:phage baseplate protein [Enterobacter bugandensis]|uniref:phage baseplate protein n=1 Tax=Enterobacter bugandensis TaxID=881260 RepID=UPI002D77EBAA|nr:hypothetical protein [Enterobacter bugandensis]WRT51549.1 hypothetical protein VK758_00130 [Enterobacter bugandensis]